MSEVQFLGGPFDGFLQKSSRNQASLPQSVVWLVSDDAFHVIYKERPAGRSCLTSVAVYELHSCPTGSRYEFVGAVSRSDFAGMLDGK